MEDQDVDVAQDAPERREQMQETDEAEQAHQTKQTVETDETEEERAQEGDAVPRGQSSPFMYACRLCRRVLFADQHILPHAKMEKRISAVGPPPAKQRSCNMYFVEPMAWMGDVQGELTGKLCKAKLGAWSWIGLPCNCGQWRSPAFQIQLRRVDNLPRGAEADTLEIQDIL
ncbi:hypothetical protein NCLIV_050170 [Neospora caninum Liverpool]|uniref:protein-tyrosine-phosphatase n=1 Tax=Neospora caninum (strain Liverpool) TaxID=572307 RepID=F0VKI8_NEOCL|nr:hypothetical protein NCLIV_050170 [Neospora caninum Liverpool]CBZ54589.1 hypothetical protein NCLIV_050170 [Neospora caninum Liverpool]|eukprot:XP_003884619.1 hypothetical protein NCLIV_050170 [Neospora caninum Liverpool]